MACTEINCRKCGNLFFSNDLNPVCQCGAKGKDLSQWWDERLDEEMEEIQ